MVYAFDCLLSKLKGSEVHKALNNKFYIFLSPSTPKMLHEFLYLYIPIEDIVKCFLSKGKFTPKMNVRWKKRRTEKPHIQKERTKSLAHQHIYSQFMVKFK